MLWRLMVLALYLLWPALARAEQQPVRVGVFHNPPIITNDQRGPGGIFIDILELTAKREGWRLVYVPGSFADGAERLQRGEIDVLPNAPHTTAREDGMSFSAEPVLSSWGQVYGSGSIKGLADLARVRVATLKGGLLEEALAQAMSGMDANILSFNSYPDAFLAVASGKADAVVANPFSGALQARLHGLHPTPVVLAPYTFRFAVTKGQHKQLLGQLDRTILELKADPSSIYFTRLQELTQARSFGFPPWFKWVAGAAMALVLAGIAWAVTLKRAARRVAASERAQRKLAAELTRISANSLDVIAVLDADFNVSRISRAAETLWGYSPSEMEGRPCFDLLHPGARAAARQVLEGVRSGPPSIHRRRG